MQSSLDTILAQAGSRWDGRTGAVSMPIYQTATFSPPELGRSTGFDYSRTANPTRSVLEETLARIDGGIRGFAFSSGLAAIDTILRLFSPGDAVIVTEDLYGGTARLLDRVLAPFGIRFIPVDTSSVDAVSQAATGAVKGLFVESPTNPLLRVADIPALAEVARRNDWIFIVDNTFLTPVNQRPLALGADVVVYSATKYLSGHNDVLAGAAVTNRADLAERIAFLQNAIGAVLGPQDSWLSLRGLKTLSLRVRRQEASAQRIAEWLSDQPRVRRVLYPGLAGHPGRDRLAATGSGFGAMVSFEVDGAGRVRQILSAVRVFLFAESLGGVESLITYPARQTHAEVDPATRERLGITERLLRLSVGIEDVADLIDDLDRAING
jgi:cystathionine beta-lyase/cystathionine gamma-synthase